MDARRFIDPRYPDVEFESTWDGVPRLQVREDAEITDDYGPSSLVSGAAGQPAKGSRGVNTLATRGPVR